MDNLLIYLLKVTAGTSLLYLGYLLLFTKDTFYLRNRIFLILTLLLPTIFPLLKIPVMSSDVVATVPQGTLENIFSPGSSFETTMTNTIHSTAFDYSKVVLWVYYTITILLLLRVVVSLLSTIQIIKKGRVEKSQFPKVIISDKQLPPFSFFPFAVIPDEDYKSGKYTDILDHEFAHLKQGHTFDLLLSELFIAFQWFNPFIWLIKRSIVLNHEYLADQVSLLHNKSVKDYQYRLLNFQPELKHISLAHNFNSLIKNRIIMINKKPSNKFAALKIVMILPVVAFVAYAFATPEYKYIAPEGDPLVISQPPEIMQKEVRGIILNEESKPLVGVSISSTGTSGNTFRVMTDSNGRFYFSNVQEDASLLFYFKGYKQLILKPVFTSEMTVKMEKDPAYKATPEGNPNATAIQRPSQIVVIDGKISEKSYSDARKDLGYDFGITTILRGKEATDKYGEKGVNGVYEITTRKKALAMGLNPPFPRLAPEDYPTFQGETRFGFSDWVASQVKYPAEAQEKKLEGWVSVNFTIELNGNLSNIVSTVLVDKILSDEVIRVVKSSPIWDPAKNPNVDEPINYGIILKFKLPDQILTEEPFVIVEQMPSFPGGDSELLDFIKNNTRYPEKAKEEKIEGKVIVRFVVSKEGNAEGVSILKGVHPLLDAEAVRVTSLLKGWNVGMQGGKPVDVWYMAPVNFSLAEPEQLFSKTSQTEILKFLVMNTGYPQEAKNSSESGQVYVVVKVEKGGIIKECRAVTEKDEINVPIMDEVVIVGYNTSSGLEGVTNTKKVTSEEHLLLKEECLRISNKLGELNIPEWKDKPMEFAIPIRFMLK